MANSVSIKGIQKVQAANVKAIAALKPKGALGRAIQWATAEAHRYAVYITHVDTGSLKASHRMTVKSSRGRVYIDRTATNPRSKQKPAIYGQYEEERGGAHAFYTRTINERGDYITSRAIKIIQGAMP